MDTLINAGFLLIEKLLAQIPVWIERGRKSGELTEEQEAGYQQRQKDIFSQPWAQPGNPLNPTN